jgi:hypothetical protein
MSKYRTIIGKANLNQLVKQFMEGETPSKSTVPKPKRANIKITLIKHLDPDQKYDAFTIKGEKWGKFREGQEFGVEISGWAKILPVVKILETTDTGGRWVSNKSEYVWRYTKD